MARLDGRHVWSLELSTDEFLLVLKGLGNRLKPEDHPAAKALGDKLTAARAGVLRTHIQTAQQLENALTEKGETGTK